MRRAWSLCLITAGAVLVPSTAVIADPVTPNWQTYQYSPEHTSWNNFATGITTTTVKSLKVGWTWVPPTIPGRPAPQLLEQPGRSRRNGLYRHPQRLDVRIGRADRHAALVVRPRAWRPPAVRVRRPAGPRPSRPSIRTR